MNKIKWYLILAVATTLALMSSCSDVQPKPRGYFRIDLPKKSYTKFDKARWPFTFDLPDSTVCVVIEKRVKEDDKYGFNIAYPSQRCCIYCDYKPVENNFRKISEDFHEFVYKHAVKADAITEQPYENRDKKVWGVLYEIKGNTASQIQFVLTDSSKHYFRGAMYPNTAPNADSLAPVTAFIKDDIVRIIESFEWKK